MAVTATWVALAAVAISWEIVCHRSRSDPSGPRWTSLSEIAARLWGSLPGRLLLVAVWAFAGWHVFARYTVPG